MGRCFDVGFIYTKKDFTEIGGTYEYMIELTCAVLCYNLCECLYTTLQTRKEFTSFWP